MKQHLQVEIIPSEVFCCISDWQDATATGDPDKGEVAEESGEGPLMAHVYHQHAYHSKFDPQLHTVSQQLIAYYQRVEFNEYRCNQCPHVGNMVILVETAELLFLITLTFEEWD